MNRKGIGNFKSEQYHRAEPSGVVSKTPRIVVEKLNIPLDSVVLVKGDSIIYPLDSAASKNSEISNDIIDITNSDDDSNVDQDVIFPEAMVKTFQSSEGPCNYNESESNNSSIRTENLDISYVSPAKSPINLEVYKPRSSLPLKVYKPRPKCKQNVLYQRSLLKEDVTLIAGNAEKLSFLDAQEKQISKSSLSDDTIDNNTESHLNASPEVSESVSDSTSSFIRAELSEIESDKSKVKSSSPHIDKDESTSEGHPLSGEEESFIETLKNLDETQEFTPSRTSQRIKNKKVKFSALQLLAGGDIYSIKKDLHADSVKKTSIPKKYAKTKGGNTADISKNNNVEESTIGTTEVSKISTIVSPSSPKNDDVANTEKTKQDNAKNSENKKVTPKKRKANLSLMKHKDKTSGNSTSPLNDKIDTKNTAKEKESTSGLPTDKKAKTVVENGDKIKKVNSKIRLELQGAPQKKVVNISISPLKESKNPNVTDKLDVALGPDIVIRRIRSDKKQVSDKTVEPCKEKTASSSIVQQDSSVEKLGESKLASNNIIVTNLLYTEKNGGPTKKEIEAPPQIKKLILETAKNKRSSIKQNDSISNDEARKKKFVELTRRKSGVKNHVGRPKLRKSKDTEDTSDREMDYDEDSRDVDQSEVYVINSSLEDGENLMDRSNDRMDLSKSPTATSKPLETKKTSKEVAFTKTEGKKTAKVTPLRQVNKVQPKIDTGKKPISEKDKEHSKFPRSKTVPRLSSPSELGILGVKRSYRNTFEKYFISTEKICEHNDSVDSDSDSEDINFLSHFVDLKRSNNELTEHNEPMEEEEETNGNDQTSVNNVSKTNITNNINELRDSSIDLSEFIKSVALDLPKWNCHVIPENSIICLILLERESNGVYDVKKCIEIDDNFKANVYIDKVLVNEYCGVYDSYDAIKNLIYQVELL